MPEAAPSPFTSIYICLHPFTFLIFGSPRSNPLNVWTYDNVRLSIIITHYMIERTCTDACAKHVQTDQVHLHFYMYGAYTWIHVLIYLDSNPCFPLTLSLSLSLALSSFLPFFLSFINGLDILGYKIGWPWHGGCMKNCTSRGLQRNSSVMLRWVSSKPEPKPTERHCLQQHRSVASMPLAEARCLAGKVVTDSGRHKTWDYGLPQSDSTCTLPETPYPRMTRFRLSKLIHIFSLRLSQPSLQQPRQCECTASLGQPCSTWLRNVPKVMTKRTSSTNVLWRSRYIEVLFFQFALQ